MVRPNSHCGRVDNTPGTFLFERASGLYAGPDGGPGLLCVGLLWQILRAQEVLSCERGAPHDGIIESSG